MNVPSFLQSAEWQEVQERMGRRTERISGVLIIRHDLPLRFHYLYSPRPNGSSRDFFPRAGEHAGRTGALFLKIDPLGPLPEMPSALAAHPLQQPATILIDCRQDGTELLAAMHPKTRYNVRLAERHGVRMRAAARPVSSADFNTFWALLREAARRDGFHPHPVAHYRILLGAGSDEFSNELFLAESNGDALAAAMVNFYLPSKTATYLHGGSSRAHRSLMAPHLLHWRIIQWCRERGFDTYDLGGIDQERWPGVTRFKLGFGGREVTYPPSADYVYRPFLYPFYQLQHRLRRMA